MSASREKKKRFEERGEGTEKRQVRAKEDFKSKKRRKLITGIVAAVVVVLVVLMVIFNSNLFYTGVTAVKVGGTNYTTADFNYEYFNTYYNTYTNMQNTYGSYASMFLDPSQPLDKQQYSETQTWEEYFENQAFAQLQQMTVLNDMADAEGWELTSEQRAEIDANIEGLKSAAAQSNYTDYRAYIRALYGKGATEKTLRKLLEKSYRATYYSQYLTEKWQDSYTEADLDEYYDTVSNDYDLITFMAYTVNSEPDEENGVDAATAMEAAKAIADEILSARDQATFADAVYRFAPEDQKADYEKEDACLRRYAAPNSISNTEWRSWLTDPERQAGDTTSIEFSNSTSSGYYVLLFLDRNDNSYELANFRGITINVENDAESGEITDATRAAAQETVDAILAAFAEDPTEDNFAALADQYDMSGEGRVGGLYENVILGQLASPEVEDFVFSGAGVGEISTIYSDGRFYITYPLENGERYDRLVAKNLKASQQYQDTMNAAEASYPVNTTMAFRFAK